MNRQEDFRIGAIIRNYRMSHHLTQEELAELIGVSAGSIGQIERDETYPRLDRLAKMVDILNIDGNVIFRQEKRVDRDNELLKNEIMICIDKLSYSENNMVLSVIKNLIALHDSQSE